MNSRLEKFKEFKTHPWLGRIYSRLTVTDMTICLEFLSLNEGLDKVDFESAVARLFLDIEKPKNLGLIQELLACANSAV